MMGTQLTLKKNTRMLPTNYITPIFHFLTFILVISGAKVTAEQLKKNHEIFSSENIVL